MQRGSGPGARDISIGDVQRSHPLAHAVAPASARRGIRRPWSPRASAWRSAAGRRGCRRGRSGEQRATAASPRWIAAAGPPQRRTRGRRGALGALLLTQGATGLGHEELPWLGGPAGRGTDPRRRARAACEPWRGPPVAPSRCLFRRPGCRRSRRLCPSPRPATWARCRPPAFSRLAALSLLGLFVGRVSALDPRSRALSEAGSCGPASFHPWPPCPCTMTRGCWTRPGWQAAPGG